MKGGLSLKVYCYGNNTYGKSYTPAGMPNIPGKKLYAYFLAVNVGSTTNPPTSSNAGSLVFAIRYNNEKFIFPGDAEGITEQFIDDNVKSDKYIDTTLYAFAHHGSRTNGSNSNAWLQKLQSNIYVASSQLHHQWYHPNGFMLHDLIHKPNLNSRLFDFPNTHYLFSSNNTSIPVYCYCTITQTILTTYTNGNASVITTGDRWEVSYSDNEKMDLAFACPAGPNYC